jgi:hypothetical protein
VLEDDLLPGKQFHGAGRGAGGDQCHGKSVTSLGRVCKQEPDSVSVRVPDFHQGRPSVAVATSVAGTETGSRRACSHSLESSSSMLHPVENWLRAAPFALRMKP